MQGVTKGAANVWDIHPGNYVFYDRQQVNCGACSAEDIAATVPPEYLLGDKELYMLSAKNSKASYSLTGVIDPSGMKSTSDMLTKFDPELQGANVDLSKTFDDRFVKKAAELAK
jgi:NitT/TauT family transport system substrate-binding protein